MAAPPPRLPFTIRRPPIATPGALEKNPGAFVANGLPTRNLIEELRDDPQFEVRERLGEGGMGVVYRAFDKKRGAEVALKTLLRMDAPGVARLKREFRALADIAHPNLVSLYELFSTKGTWFFTMELIVGPDFVEFVRERDVSRRSGRSSQPPMSSGPSIARLRRALRQLVCGIEAVHEAGKLHLDLKPSNVLVGGDGRVVVLDFGLARDAEIPDEAPVSLREPPIMGTPTYMAPEQIRGEHLSPAADWYALGGILYCALAGRPPFEGDPHLVISMKQHLLPPAPADLAEGVPGDLSDLCMALLAPTPEARANGADVMRTLGGSRLTPVPPRHTPVPPRISSVPPRTSPVPPRISPVPITPAPAPPFVGRTKEIEALWGAFEEAVEGRPAAIFVHGSSGIGKTALVGHFLSSLRARRPSVILAGRCYERESLPFKAFDSVIDVLCAHLRARASSGEQAPLPEDIHDLARLFPALLEIPGIHDVAPRSAFRASPLEARARAFRALKALFSTVAARGPLVLHVDDLQWGDRDSALLLLEILGPPAPPPIFVLGTYRSEDALASEFLRVIFGEDLRDGAGSAVVRTIKLEPLAEAEAEELALALLDGSELSRDTASRVAREAKGSPFFVTELAQSLRMEAWTAQVDATSAEATVERLLIARIERLPSDARRILEIVAVAGQPIEQGAALRAAKLHGEGPPALAALRSGHLVRTRGAGPTDAVEVYHDRVRQVALSQIPKERRSLRHLCLARALELTGRAEAETLATHFREGGDRESAGRYALEAAEQAMGSLAFDNAARLYRIALDQGSIGQASARDLLSKLGAALVSAGRNTEAAGAFLQASAGAPALLALDFKRKAATLFLLSGRADKGIPVLREVLAGVGLTYPATPRRAFASLLFNRARLAIRGRRFEERDEASIDPASLSTIDICHGAFTGLAAVDPIRCAGFLSRYLLLALAAGEPRRIAVGLAWDALYGLFVGGSARAEEALAAASSLADRLEDANARGLVILVRAMKSWGEGTWAEAAGLAGEAERALFSRGEGSAWAMATAQVVQGSCLLALGDLKALAARLPVWLRAAADRGDRYAMISLRTNAGAASVLALAAGDPAGARAELERAMALWTREGFDMQHLGALKSGVLVDLYEGDGSGARARVAAAWPALEGSMLLRGKLARIWALMLRAGAALGAASSAGEGRKRLLSEAERDARRLASEAGGTMIGASASAALIRASAAALAGDGPRARSLLESAIEGFEAASMQLDAAAARRRLGELVGGEEGRAIREGADAWMAAQGVLRPERLTAALAPGFESENK